MAIPKKLEDVGYNQATVKMDVDALTRESMIRLFNLGIDEYDEKYNEFAKTNTGLLPENPGPATIVKQFILLEGQILGFIFQQFISIVKPIQTALELPELLSNPTELAEKIKEIIDGIKDLIEEVISFFTDTLNWFMGLLLGPIKDINIPIPELDFSILGITIPIPSIDNKNAFGKDPYKEKNNDKTNKLKEKITTSRDEIKNIIDKVNPDINALQVALLALLNEELSKLYSVDHQLVNDFLNKAIQIHDEVLIKKDEIVRKELNEIKNINDYKFKNKIATLNGYKKYLNSNFTVKNYINVYTGSETTLIDMPDRILNVIETEEEEIEYTVNIFNMEKNINLKNKFDTLDIKLNIYNAELLEILDNIRSTNSEIDDIKDQKIIVENNIRDTLVGSVAATQASNKINNLKNSIKIDRKKLAEESPGSAWIDTVIDFIIGIIKTPIDLVIGIIKKIIEGILEFIEELPLPTFSKIKEFFSDLLGLGNLDKMKETITNLIIGIIADIEDFKPVIDNVVSFLPWLFVEVAKTFITGVVEPLPIPI